MVNKENTYVGLCVLLVSLIILGNLTYQKFVILKLPFYHFELSVGAILYPITFLITDLLSECYGKAKARFAIQLALASNILMVLLIALMDHLPATAWSSIDDATFHKVFGYYGMAVIASLLACYSAQTIDVRLYLWLNRLTQGKYLWLRSNGSTGIALLLDTTMVVGFMTFWGILPLQHMGQLIINSYSWKLFFTLCNTPFFYLSVGLLKKATL